MDNALPGSWSPRCLLFAEAPPGPSLARNIPENEPALSATLLRPLIQERILPGGERHVESFLCFASCCFRSQCRARSRPRSSTRRRRIAALATASVNGTSEAGLAAPRSVRTFLRPCLLLIAYLLKILFNG